jgi:hypothetical protein
VYIDMTATDVFFCNLRLLTGVYVKTAAFWDVVLCILVEIHHCYRGTYCRLSVVLQFHYAIFKIVPTLLSSL